MSLFRSAGLLLVKRLEGISTTVMMKDLLSERKIAILSGDKMN